jgi:hypothetical protein
MREGTCLARPMDVQVFWARSCAMRTVHAGRAAYRLRHKCGNVWNGMEASAQST